MKIYLTFDDTDNLESIGTGKLLEQFAEIICQKFGIKTSYISRHQLFVHENIPYTSHNSSMCITTDIKEEDLNEIIAMAQQFLVDNSAVGSDPGLCVAVKDEITDPNRLIAYGKRAKTSVLTKDEAYDLAKELNVHLSEHGGTGGGVIGALAGIGLRMTGNDGRIKGKYYVEREGDFVSAGEILDTTGIEVITTVLGEKIPSDTLIRLGEKVKCVLLNHKNTLLVEKTVDENNKEIWQTIPREKIRSY